MRALAYAIWGLALVGLLLPWFLQKKSRSPSSPPRDELVKDPACQTYVVKSRALRRENRGVVQYFCSEDCVRRHHATS